MNGSSKGPRIAVIAALLSLSCALALVGCGAKPGAESAGSSADSGALGFDTDSPVDQLEGISATDTATPAATAEPAPAPAAPTSPAPAPATQLTADSAGATVAQYLELFRTDQTDQAKAMVTPRFVEAAGEGYFRPVNGVFLSYAVDKIDTLPGGVFDVWATEQWISGPEKMRYTVVAQDGQPMLDFIVWNQQ